jgi:exodeoxyribonuclease VII large subunit
VTGEVAGLKASPSGHVYFSLKDAGALIDCVLWRSAAVRVRELPRDGDQATVHGRLSVYEPRGRYQLTVSSFSADLGKGDLWLRFEALRQSLAAEGLFDAARKRRLPALPGTIGIVTSPTGAALRDMVKILARRAPGARVIVSPCLVQGAAAVADIVRALSLLDRWGGADVIIVGRGGGSIEDIWPFNEEAVARAVGGLRTPVVSAVGHETDFTLTDFAADVRAATPSEAAEMVVPDHTELLSRLVAVRNGLARALSGLVRSERERLVRTIRSRAYRRPEDILMPRWQRLDDAASRLSSAAATLLSAARNRLSAAETRLACLSPGQVLARGYAIAVNADGSVLSDASAITPGARIGVILRRGCLDARVERISPGHSASSPAS